MRLEGRVRARPGSRRSEDRPLARRTIAAGWHVARGRRFDRALTLWASRRAGAGRLPQGTCRWTGCWQASGPFARFISQASPRRCALRSARERRWNSARRAFRHNAVGGGWKERSAEKRDADASGPGGRGSERKYGRLSVGCGRFRRTSLQPAWIARRQQRGLRRRPVLRGRDGHRRATALQDAEAVRRWQGRGECVLSGQTGPSEASGVPG